MGSRPGSGSALTAQSLQPVSDSVSPSVSSPPLLVLCLSPSKINKNIYIYIFKRALIELEGTSYPFLSASCLNFFFLTFIYF